LLGLSAAKTWLAAKRPISAVEIKSFFMSSFYDKDQPMWCL
jgi:hypothetical protein